MLSDVYKKMLGELYDEACLNYNTDKLFIIQAAESLYVVGEEFTEFVSGFQLSEFNLTVLRKLVKSLNEYTLLVGYYDFAIIVSQFSDNDKTLLFCKMFGNRCTGTFDFETGDIVS